MVQHYEFDIGSGNMSGTGGIYNSSQIHGPWYDSTSGDYYVCVASSQTPWDYYMFRSTDGGDTYTEQDSSNRPTPGGGSTTIHCAAGTTVYDSSNRYIWLFYWDRTAANEYTLRAVSFNCANNTWSTTTYASAQASHMDGFHNKVGVDAEYQSSTDIGVLFMGEDVKIMGNAYERVNFQPFNPSTPAWGTAVEIENGAEYDHFAFGFTYNDSGDAYCIIGANNDMNTYSVSGSTVTDRGRNMSTGYTEDVGPAGVRSATVSGSEEFAIAHEFGAGFIYWDHTTTPNTNPWTSDQIDADSGWIGGERGAGICYNGNKRYYISWFDTGTNKVLRLYTKDGTGSWTEEGDIYTAGSGNVYGNIRPIMLATSPSSVIGVCFTQDNGTEIRLNAVIWDEADGFTRTKEASVDALTVPPEGVIGGYALPEVWLDDTGLFYGSRETHRKYLIGVAKDNAKELILLVNANNGRHGIWTEVDSMWTFANDIKSLHVTPAAYAGFQVFCVTTQLSNGDVYWGMYKMEKEGDPGLSDWQKDEMYSPTGAPSLSPRLVASPGTPDEFGAICTGVSYHDFSAPQVHICIFFHQKVSTKNKIMFAHSKHDHYYGDYETIGGSYFTDAQRLDPDSTDDEYLGVGHAAYPEVDGTTTATGWQSFFHHVVYTRVGASATNLIKRQVWPSTIFAMYTDATSGTFDLTWNDRSGNVNRISSATNIAYNASAATIKSALEGITGVDTVAVTGTGTKSDPWIVDFVQYSQTNPSTYTDSPPHQCVAYFEPDSTNLTGGTAYVAVPTVETDLGAVKHPSRPRGYGHYPGLGGAAGVDWQGDFTYGTTWYEADTWGRVFFGHVGTDEKPMLIASGNCASINPTALQWDWRNQWDYKVYESGIGTKLVKMDANDYPLMCAVLWAGWDTWGDWKIPDSAGYDRTEHRIVMLVEKTTDDVHIIARRLRDTDSKDPYDPM